MATPNFDEGARDLLTVSDVANSPADTTVTRNGDTILTLTGAINKMAVSAGKPFDNEAELLATPIPDPPYIAEVLHDPDPAKNGRYSPVTGAWVMSAPGALSIATQEVQDRQALIDGNLTDLFSAKDERNFAHAYFGKDVSFFCGIERRYREDIEGDLYVDERGFVHNPPASWFAVEDDEQEVSTDIDLKKVYFSKTLCAWDEEETAITVSNLVADRTLQNRTGIVRASIASVTEPYFRQDRDVLAFEPGALGAQAELVIKDTTIQQSFAQLLVSVKTVSQESAATPFGVLMIGDSITNRGGSFIIDKRLVAKGYAPSMIGTVLGADDTGISTSTGGKLSEGREGWELSDYTYLITDRASPVAVGDESTYLSMSKAEQMNRNPFIRLAVEGDDPSIVRNGYVLDFAFYLSRFSLATPEVVVVQLGTNDSRDRTPEEIYANFLSEYPLLISRIQAAMPAAKIILSLPAPANNDEWDINYRDEYSVMLAALPVIAEPFTGVTICPSWAFMPNDTGFTQGSEVLNDTTTGWKVGTKTDAVHPSQGGRYSLYNAVSAYVACAHKNLI